MTNPARLTASKLRQDIYRVLDRVLETGEPVEIERHGRRLRIVPTRAVRSAAPGRLQRLPRRAYLRCAPERLVHTDWSRQWRP